MGFIPWWVIQETPESVGLTGLDNLPALVGGLLDGSEVVTQQDLEAAVKTLQDALAAIRAELKFKLKL